MKLNIINVKSALAILAISVMCSCSKLDGEPVTQEFSIDGTYTELQVEDAFDVTVSDAVSQVTVTAGDNIMSKVKVVESGDKLEIYLKGWTVSHGKMTVLLPVNPGLRKVKLSGASDFHGDIVAEKAEITLSGSSDFKGGVSASTLDLNVSGSSDATLEGMVGKLNLAISGSSDLEKKVVDNRYALACDECKGSISGSSSAYIHCDGTINVSVSGSSDLHYTGNASTSGSTTSGSSDITHDVL